MIFIKVNSKKKYQPFILNDRWENGINELYYVKYKSKFNKRYQCTPISMYCRHLCKAQIKECLSKGAKLTIPDTYGLYPIDYIFTILKFNHVEIKEFWSCLRAVMHVFRKQYIKCILLNILSYYKILNLN